MGLIGENGAGKSTTIRLILNALSRDGGTVAVYGKDKSTTVGAEDTARRGAGRGRAAGVHDPPDRSAA